MLRVPCVSCLAFSRPNASEKNVTFHEA
jgi:hypothetical protein